MSSIKYSSISKDTHGNEFYQLTRYICIDGVALVEKNSIDEQVPNVYSTLIYTIQ